MKRILPILLLFLALSGCATKRIDWNSRIDGYTYDQAIVELGPPDKAAKLSNGSTIAEWDQSSSGPSIGLGTGIGHGPVGVGIGVPVTSSSRPTLQLTFDQDGNLRNTNQKQISEHSSL